MPFDGPKFFDLHSLFMLPFYEAAFGFSLSSLPSSFSAVTSSPTAVAVPALSGASLPILPQTLGVITLVYSWL